MTSIIQRLKNLINWSKLEAPDGYDFYTTKDGKMVAKNLSVAEKPKMAQIIKLKSMEEEIKEILGEK
jgi:hypothetical protein